MGSGILLRYVGWVVEDVILWMVFKGFTTEDYQLQLHYEEK